MQEAPLRQQLISAGLVIALLLLSLFATDYDKRIQQNASTQNKITIVFSHLDYRADKLYTQRDNPLQEIIAKFEASHPNIQVEEQLLPYNTTQRHQYYSINFDSQNDYIDVIAMDVIWIQEFAKAGWIRNIDTYVDSQDKRDFFSIYADVNSYNHQLYALPWIFNAGVLYYRDDYLKKYGFSPPKTYEDLINQVQVILKSEQDKSLYGFLWAGKQYEGLICVALEFIYGHGAEIIQNNTVPVQDNKLKSALTFMRQLIKSGITPDNVLTDTGNATRQYFLEGKGIFIRNWLHHYRNMLHYKDIEGKVKFTNLPAFQGFQSSPILGGDCLGISAFSKHPKEAFQFIEFLTSQPSQEELLEELGFFPTRYSLYKNPAILNRYPHFTYVIESIVPNVRYRPLTPYYLIISNILQSEFSAIISGIRNTNTSLNRIKSQVEYILSIESGKKPTIKSK